MTSPAADSQQLLMKQRMICKLYGREETLATAPDAKQLCRPSFAVGLMVVAVHLKVVIGGWWLKGVGGSLPGSLRAQMIFVGYLNLMNLAV